MYAFMLRPKWMLSHVLVAALIVATIIMGFWQLDRLDQRRTSNDEIESRLEAPVAELTSLVQADDAYNVGEAVRYRLVTAAGEYVAEDEVLVLNRSFAGQPGYWVLTPLRLDDGTALVVNRGWIPFRFAPGADRVETAAPEGRVVVEGMVRETVEAEGIQSADRSGVVLEALARPDLERLQEQLAYDIQPVYLQLESTAGSTEEPGGLPALLDRPELDDGPHLSYAMQWFIFATVGIIGYPLVLRRVARTDGKDGRHSDIPAEYL